MLVKNQDLSLLNSSGIMIERTYLTGKNTKRYITITKSLTATQMKKLNEAREIHDFKNVWTSNGKILFRNGPGNTSVLYD